MNPTLKPKLQTPVLHALQAMSTHLPVASALFATATFSSVAWCQAAAQTTQTVLPTVEVTGTQAASSAVQSYRAQTTRSTKSLQDPQDVPQALTTVTQELIQDQQGNSLKDALKNVSGLTFNAAEGGRSGDNMMLRGFYTFGDIYLDGIRDTAQYNRELFNIEQVDVLRGAAAMLFGRGQAGGVINQVSKVAHTTTAHSLSTTVGTQGTYDVNLDLNQSLGANSGLRLNTMNRYEGSDRVNPSNEAAPSLRRNGYALAYGLGIGTQNELNVIYQYSQTKDKPDYGVAFNNTTHQINTVFGPKDYWGVDGNFDDSQTKLTTVSHIHRFATGGEVKTQFREGDYQRAYWAKTPSATLAPSITGATGGNQTRSMNYKTQVLQSDLNKTVQLASMSHELLLGAEFMRESSSRIGLQNQGTTTTPIYTANVVSTTASPVTFTGISRAIYAQDTVSVLPYWKLTAGVRKDQLDSQYSSTTSPQLSFSETSTRAGVSWQPNDTAHYYLSVSDSFSPTADLYQLSGGAYPAERSRVKELGAKWLLAEGDLSLRAALYQADKFWERSTDLESTAAILTKQRQTNGLDLEAAGRVTSKWEVFAGLSLLDARIIEVAENRNAATGLITQADPRLKGVFARNTPKYTFNVWTNYDLGKGWKMAAGAEVKGRRLVYQPSTSNANGVFTNGDFTPNTVGAYAKFDAMVSYETGPWLYRLNVKNIGNKVYYDALYDNGGFAVPGSGRTVLLTMNYQFD